MLVRKRQRRGVKAGGSGVSVKRLKVEIGLNCFTLGSLTVQRDQPGYPLIVMIWSMASALGACSRSAESALCRSLAMFARGVQVLLKLAWGTRNRDQLTG